MKRWGPLKSTPPNTSAALTWPWYLQQQTRQSQHSAAAKISKPKKRSLRTHLKRCDLSIVMAVTTLDSRPVA